MATLTYPSRQLGVMESLALERVYWSKFGSGVPCLSFEASYKTPFASVGVGSLGARAHYHLMKDEVTNVLHLDFFPVHRCFIWNSCEFTYVGCGNLYLGEQGRDGALLSKWTRSKANKILNVYLVFLTQQTNAK